MGEAKRRGTFEERKLESMDRQEKENHEREIIEQIVEKNMTPGQKARRRKAQGLLAVMVGMASTLDKS